MSDAPQNFGESSRRLRIALMTDTYLPIANGVTHSVALLAREYLKMGHEPHVFTFAPTSELRFSPEGLLDESPHLLRVPPRGDETHEDGFAVYHAPALPLLNSGYFLGVRYPVWMAKKLRNMDVLHAHHPFVSGRIARRHAGPQQPVILTTHTRYDLYGHYLGQYMGRALPFRRDVSTRDAKLYEKSDSVPLLGETVSRLAALFANRCDAVIAPSASMGQVLRRWGVESKIEVVPNGIELERFHRAAEQVRSEKVTKQSDELRVIYVGRVASEKNLLTLIQAFELAMRDVPQATLHIVGDGPLEPELKAMCAASELENKVVFRGALPYDEVPRALAESDLFASASISEVHPLTFIEAMAAGVPCVGTPSPGVIDSVEDGYNGWLGAPDAESFADALRSALHSREERKRRAANALESSRSYAIAQCARRTMEIYQAALLQNAVALTT